MSKNTNFKTPNPDNPSSLKSRYEIRQLVLQDAIWAAAIVCHSNNYYSALWPFLYPDNVATMVHNRMEVGDYLIKHQIESGLSFGVFDTEYVYKTEEAKELGGKLFWDRSEPGIQHEQGMEADAQRLLKQMDFPLVSVALSHDAFNALDVAKMKPFLAMFPPFGVAYRLLQGIDTRDPSSWQPTGPGQVLYRNATATRRDYEGKGLMAGLARWLMREADQRGFRAISIGTMSDAVTHVWSNAEEGTGYKADVVCEFHTGTWRDENGNLPFAPAQQTATKCYVHLKPKS